MAYRKSLDFLPSIFQTKSNEKLLRATMDQLISEPEVRQLNGYIGRKFNPALTPSDSYIFEEFVDRQNYQLEPSSLYTDDNKNIKFVSSYVDLIRRIEDLGGIVDNPSRLFSADQYSYSGLFDFDKFVNYSSYYWLPNGPDEVSVFATDIPVDQDIEVISPSIYTVVDGRFDTDGIDSQGFDVSGNDISRLSKTGYTFDTTGNLVNPVIRVARGGTYRFNVNQFGHGFFIQTLPGNTVNYPWQKNLSIREVLGVENNGEDVGTVTFNVPTVDAQDFFLTMDYQGSVNLVAYSFKKRRQLRYTEIQNANYNDFLNENIGIDGQRFIDGKNILFLPSSSEGRVPQPWLPNTLYSEGDLVIYANTVYRVIADYNSSRFFTTGNLEIYDLEDHWYDPALFDATDVGFDGGNFDRGSDVPAEQRLGWFRININNEGIIELSPVETIPTNKRVFVGEGVEYGNREVYRSANDRLELVPPITANLNFLYYQDALDPNINGIIEIVDQDNTLEINVESILNKTEYTSPNGVVFENGLKIKFIGNTVPSEFENKSYYVEGVGESISLVETSKLETPETWLDTVSTPYDSTAYDAQGFDESQPAPIDKQYIGIKRNSREGSAWSRQNRWFHQDVITNTSFYNKFNTVLDQQSRAKRPIIEFDPDLQLYNFGKTFKTSVTVIDNREIDALSNVEGTPAESVDGVISTYYSDGIPLVNGNRVIFANDNSQTVRETIWRVDWITPESSLNNRTVDFTGDGVTTSFDLNFDVTTPTRLRVTVNGTVAQDSGYLWSLIGQNIVFSNAPIDGADITVNYSFGQQIHLVPVDTVTNDDVILSTLGNTNQGTNWYYNGNSWVKAQNKTQSNQAPLFDLYDKDRNSISDNSVYNGSNFVGNKIFSYKIGNTTKDSELGIRLAYRNIGNVGDILFVDHITNDTFSYESIGESSITSSTKGLEVAKNLNNSRTYVNQWVKLSNKTKQYQTETFFATQYEKNQFKLNIFPDALGPDNILVYKNNVPLTEFDFDIEIISDVGYLLLTADAAVDDKIDVKVYSSKFNNRSIWEIPSNLENNAKNQDIKEITLGQLRNHILESFINTPEFSGAYQGSNNVKDLPTVKVHGGKIVQNAGAPHLANLFLNDTKANFVESLLYTQREYANFKNRFQRLSADLPLRDSSNAVQCVDEILKEISANKNQQFPYYYSDMVPAGDDYTKLSYTIDNTSIDSYYLSSAFDINSASNRAVLVYLNSVQLTYGLDYTFSNTQPVINLNIAPERPEQNRYYLNIALGDVIEIREYNSTNGFHVPQTPTKLGMYPAYRPKIIQDGYSGNTVNAIRGHDGSLTVAYGDYRDNILLELEKRIYNNIKSRYTGELFNVTEKIPGAFRTTEYSKTEFDTILSSNFSIWLGKNNLQVNDLMLYDSNDSFTWNYSNYADFITGGTMPAAYWRGLYKYFYDTDQPHLRPWEMLGFTEEPEWWITEYGPAPYTSGNTVLWSDLEAGRIKQGDRAGIDSRFARPGLVNIVPVNDSGILLPPFECLALNTSITTSGKFVFGDGSPVETAWRQSSEYPFAIQIAMALAKPAEYFGSLRDTIDQVSRKFGSASNSQWEFASTGVRSKVEYVHGEVVENEVQRTHGYTTWISEYATSLNLDITDEVGKKLRGIDLRLAYKLGGYTDKKYIKLYADQSSPNSINSSVLIPDDDYQIKLVKSSPRLSITYSGVIVTRSGTGFSVRGYDQSKPYFIAETGKNSGETVIIKSGIDTVSVAKHGSGRFVNIPYGTEFLDKSEVVEFLIGLGRYQERQGFRFDKKVEGTNNLHNWTLAAKEFLFWTQQGWDNDVAITLSPIGDEINFRSTRGAVDAISNRPYGSRILNSNFEIIDSKKYNVNRNGREFSLSTNDNTGIYLVDIDVVDYEHVIVLNNITQFNDVIYQPDLGNRQYRIKITGFKTGAWDGTFGAAGFIINDNNIQNWQPGKNYYKGEIVKFKDIYSVALSKTEATLSFDNSQWTETEYKHINSTLLPNLSNRAGLPKSFYDFNSSNLEIDADRLAKSLIGFSPRDYLDNLQISDTSQVKFYQGLIGQKGSNNSLNKLLRAKLDNFAGRAEIFEQWAIRDGYYGANGNTRELRLPLSKTTSTSKNPIVIELLNDNDNAVDGRVSLRSKDLLTYARPYNKNFLSYRNSKSEVNDLPAAGFIKIDEVDYTSPNLTRISEFLDNDVSDGSRVWVGRNDYNDWNVYRFTDVNVVVSTVSIDGTGVATIVTNGAHGLELNQRIYVKGYSSTSLRGFYQISKVIDDNTFRIRTNFVQSATSAADARIYILVELKKDNIDGIVLETPQNGWREGDQFYLENATDLGWGVYEKTERYTAVNRYSDSDISSGDNLGVSVSSSRNNNYLLAGSSASNTVETYKRLPNGTLVEDVEIVNPSTGLTDFGAVISASSAEYAAVGSPASGSNVGYIHILRRDTNGSFIVDQAIAPEALATNGGFGSAVALSDDARWLYVGQPDYLEGYVWVYQLIQADSETTQRFLGDGSTTDFTLTGDAAIAGTNIYALKIANKDGKIMIPFRDYTYNSSTKVITFTSAPAFGETNVFFRNYYNFVLAATLESEISDRFAASLATSTDGSQVIIGAPKADDNSTIISDSGKVYIVDRTVENQFADGATLAYSTTLNINGTPLVKVDNDVKISGIDYTFDGTNTITFTVAPSSGSIITIDSNNPVLSQIISETADNGTGGPATGAQFGYSIDLCPTNCSLYIGSPFDDYSSIDGGRVYRFINQGRFYGVDIGSVINPTISISTIISINNFLVSFSGGENLTTIVNTINNASIPGVTALSENNVLTIETDREVFADKLKLVQITGNFLDDVGMKVYESQQAIESPLDKNFNNFGKVVKVSADATVLAVGTDVGDTVTRTTFDSQTTRFDSRTTQFFANKKQSGSVLLYQLISKPNATVNDPSRFIYAEQLTADDIAEFDQFGASIDFSNNTVYVGAPGKDYNSNSDSGIVYGFSNNSGLKTWDLIRSENQKVDIGLINKSYIYDTVSGEKIIDLDIIDPAKGYVSGAAQQEIKYQTTVDPAFYNNDTNTSKGIAWGKDHTGEIWWNTALTRWVEYEQDTIEYRAANWGFSFPGSRIICAEWTESNQPPENYIDENNPEAYPINTTDYNVFSEYNENTGRFTNKYYFWVAGKTSAPSNVNNRSFSAIQIEELISNPKLNRLPYIVFLDSNSIGLYNVDNLLTDNSALVIDYDVEKNNNVIHSEYELIAEGDQNSLPSENVVNKLIDSLAGQDRQGNLVPDITLNNYEKLGTSYRPRQSMFSDRTQSVKEAVAYVNNFLKDIPAVYSKNISSVIASEPFPSSTVYGEAVENYIELTYLDIGLLPIGYLVLVKNDETTRNRWVIYRKDADETWKKNRVQSYNNNRYIERVTWTDPAIDVPAVIETVVDREFNLQVLTPSEGDFVKIRDNGLGLFKVVMRENNSWATVQEERGTIQLSESLWKTENNLQGWDRDGFGLQLFDDWPSIEIQNIFRALYSDVFLDEHSVQKNLWFLHMIKYALSEVKYSDWIVKTSLIKVNQTQRALQQIPVYQRDNQDLISEYINEVKPYHTKVSEFVLQYNGDDRADLNTTDFDLPAYYNFATGTYRSPTGSTVEDQIILQLDPYIDWSNNYTLELSDIDIYHPGSGYLTPPNVSLVGGGGSGATAIAVVSSGSIVDIIVTNPGTGYITTPTVILDQLSIDPAILNARMINRKVRSFDTTIKFDRVSTTAGWLVHFKDINGNPVDVRNERVSRISGSQGVIDEVLNLFSINNWVVASEDLETYPVANVPNFRVFDDTSGRVQFFDRRDTRGWTPGLLQQFIAGLGASAGVNGLDVRGTTVVEDGSLASFAPSVLPWTPGFTYYTSDIVVYDYKLYTVTTAFIAPTQFDTTYLLEYTGADLESHIDRTWAFYQPKDGMPGRDLTQLFDNVVFPGVNVIGASFRENPGFDVGLYDSSGFDISVIGPEGVSVIDPSILDQTLYSSYLDTSLGTKPEDIVTQGGSFVDTYHSHAPEEMVPGRVYDTLSLIVHTVATTPEQVLEGYSPPMHLITHIGDGSTNSFSFDSDNLGDYFLVYTKETGPRYRTNSFTDGSVTSGYYNNAKNNSYTVNWKNKTINFATPISSGDILNIVNIGQIGQNIIADQLFVGDGETGVFEVTVDISTVGNSLVLINGIEVTDYSIVAGVDGKTYYEFVTAPAVDDRIHIVVSKSATRNTISKILTQVEKIDATDYEITLDEDLRRDRSKDSTIIVELNGSRLRPGNSVYYTGDGSTNSFLLPGSAKENYSSLSFADVQVWKNKLRQDATDYVLTDADDGSSLPMVTFFTTPFLDDDISITYTKDAEYFVDEQDNKLRISENLSFADNSLIAVTSFSDHDVYKIKTKVFSGTDQFVSTSEVQVGFDKIGFDQNGFDAIATIEQFKVEYQIDETQNIEEKIFVSYDGVRLKPNRDYSVTNGVVNLASSLLINDNTEIVITWFSPKVYTNATTFQIFNDMNGNVSYNRVAAQQSTTLAQELKITDSEIKVTDGSSLGEPNPTLGIPGIIFVGKERIVYYEKQGNILRQLRRGTAGTAAALSYATGFVVTDAGNRTAIPGNNNKVWYDSSIEGSTPSNGLGLQTANTIQAKFLKEFNGIIPIDSFVQIGGYILSGYVVDGYVE